jgi:hypothetical protein
MSVKRTLADALDEAHIERYSTGTSLLTGSQDIEVNKKQYEKAIEVIEGENREVTRVTFRDGYVNIYFRFRDRESIPTRSEMINDMFGINDEKEEEGDESDDEEEKENSIHALSIEEMNELLIELMKEKVKFKFVFAHYPDIENVNYVSIDASDKERFVKIVNNIDYKVLIEFPSDNNTLCVKLEHN